MATKKKAEKVEEPKEVESDVKIERIDVAHVEIKIKGTTPLIVHAFSDKGRKMMEAKQMGEARQKKAPKVPHEEYMGSLYTIKEASAKGGDGVYGFPASGLKNAIVSACRYVEGINMTYARGAFHILGDPDDEALVRIEGPPPRMRTDTVRLNSGFKPVADIRYRPEFRGWGMTLKIEINRSAISLPQLVNLINVAGFGVGIGEWRPERRGSWGRFEVVNG